MDRIDREILAILQADSRISNQDLADQVALSPSPCFRRVKQLEAKGYIEKQVVLLNKEALGLQLTVIVLVGLSSHTAKITKKFEKVMQQLPEVVQCYLMTGQTTDY